MSFTPILAKTLKSEVYFVRNVICLDNCYVLFKAIDKIKLVNEMCKHTEYR